MRVHHGSELGPPGLLADGGELLRTPQRPAARIDRPGADDLDEVSAAAPVLPDLTPELEGRSRGIRIGSNEVRSLGPGYFPRRRSRRIAKSSSDPRLTTVVKPARSVAIPTSARAESISASVIPAQPGRCCLSRIPAMWTWPSIRPGRTVRAERSWVTAIAGGNRADGRAGDRDDDVAALAAESVEHAAGADGDGLAGAAAQRGGDEPCGKQKTPGGPGVS